MPASPIYFPESTAAAWQLNWSLTVFWRLAPGTDDWLVALRDYLETDGIRLLEHKFSQLDRSLFWLSTLPSIAPAQMINQVKGRLQYLVSERWPKALRRNYDLHSIGSTKRDKAEQYVATQLQHHYPDDPYQRAILSDLQIINPHVDLSRPRFTAHARYRCNLHLVLNYKTNAANETGIISGKHLSNSVETSTDRRVRSMIRNSAESKRHLLSRLGLLSDHMHLILGFNPLETPQDVALSYMNNIAYVYGMQPVLMPSYYVGTIGEYDLGALGASSR